MALLIYDSNEYGVSGLSSLAGVSDAGDCVAVSSTGSLSWNSAELGAVAVLA